MPDRGPVDAAEPDLDHNQQRDQRDQRDRDGVEQYRLGAGQLPGEGDAAVIGRRAGCTESIANASASTPTVNDPAPAPAAA
jgi:hypothetical protein